MSTLARPRTSLHVQVLEDRTVPATLIVNSLGDNTTAGNGQVTLREAIIAANTDAATDTGQIGNGNDTIQFANALIGQVITLGTELPAITSNITIAGPGSSNLRISGNNAVRIVSTTGAGSLTVSGLTLASGNAGGGNGGAILNTGAGTLTANDVMFVSNAAASGGAVRTNGTSAGTSFTNCIFFGNNAAAGFGGGISSPGAGDGITITNCTFTNNTAGTGGAVSQVGTLTIINSTFDGNSSTSTGAGAVNNNSATSVLTMTNCTISGNSAVNNGGGVVNQGTATLNNCTITGNRADSDGNSGGSGGGVFNNGTMTLNNTIVAGNFLGSSPSLTASDVSGLNVNGSSAFNLIGDAGTAGGMTNGSNSNQVGVPAPLLGNLSSNGGITQTIPLLVGSPAINAGNPLTGGLDQRGLPASGVRDIGAFESQAIAITPTTLPNGAVSTPFAQALAASGGVGPYTFSLVNGTFPPGLTLSTVGGISGTPTLAGNFAFTVSVTDTVGNVGAQVLATVIAPGPLPPPIAKNNPLFLPTPGTVLIGGQPNGAAIVSSPVNGKYPGGDALNFFPGSATTVRTATADVNGDGTLDYIGATGPGVVTKVVILDGKTRNVIGSFQPFEEAFTGGLFVAAADFDRDGKSEIVVSPDEGGGPVVAIYNGSGSERFRYLGIDDPSFRGGARPALGDVTGDGVADVIVAAGILGGPRVTVWDGKATFGKSPKSIANFFAFENSLRNGTFIAAGDLTGDGVSDIAFGGGPGGAPRVRVFDGAKLMAQSGFTFLDEIVDKAQTNDFFAGDTGLRGGVRLSFRDADGDAHDDLITASGDGETSNVNKYFGSKLVKGESVPDQNFDPFGAVLTNGVFIG